MRTKLSTSELRVINSLSVKIYNLMLDYQANDYELSHGNGLVSDQLSVAFAALETIVQEF